MRVRERDPTKAQAHWLNEDRTLSIGEHHAVHADQPLRGHRVPDDRERLLSYGVTGDNVINKVC
jgi:hypothetical protein